MKKFNKIYQLIFNEVKDLIIPGLELLVIILVTAVAFCFVTLLV